METTFAIIELFVYVVLLVLFFAFWIGIIRWIWRKGSK